MKLKQNYDHHLGGYRTEEELEAARAMALADIWISAVVVVLILALAACFLLLP